MIRRPPRSTQSRSSAASDVYKRQDQRQAQPDCQARPQAPEEETPEGAWPLRSGGHGPPGRILSRVQEVHALRYEEATLLPVFLLLELAGELDSPVMPAVDLTDHERSQAVNVAVASNVWGTYNAPAYPRQQPVPPLLRSLSPRTLPAHSRLDQRAPYGQDLCWLPSDHERTHCSSCHADGRPH